MGINDPRVPTRYPALDSAAFSRAGGPALDALLLDGVAQAHNHLQSHGTHSFALAVPIAPITFGDSDTIVPYSHNTTRDLRAIVHDFRFPKKPGHAYGEFKLELRIPPSKTARLILFTLGNPSGTTATATGTGTGLGDWQTVTFSNVPLQREAAEEFVKVSITGTDVGSEHTAGTYGTPVTGWVSNPGMRGDSHIFLLQTTTPSLTALNWNTEEDTPDDYGSRGYYLRIYHPTTSAVLATFTMNRIVDESHNGYWRIAYIAERVPDSVRQAMAEINRTAAPTDFTEFKIFDPVLVSFGGLAGCTMERSP